MTNWTPEDTAYRPGGLPQPDYVDRRLWKFDPMTGEPIEQPDLAQVGEVGVWGEQQLPLKARHAAQEALNALMRWQEICLAKNRSTKELTIPTKAIHVLTEILEVKGREQ